MRKYLSILAIILIANVLQAQNFDTIRVQHYPVQGKIEMITGWGGNIAVLPGEDGAVMIDDQMAELNPKIMKAIAEITDDPVRYVINTHFHYDHTDGNKVMGKKGSLIIAQENVRKRLTTDQFIEYFKRPQPAYEPAALPKVTFLDSLTFHMNGEEIKIYHFDNAHTDGDAIIYFENSNVVHMGDILVTYGFPFVDVPNGGSVPGIINCINKVLDMTNNNTLFIPGHGRVYNRAELIAFRDMLKTITDRVKAEKDKGKMLSEIDVKAMISGYEKTGGRPAADFVMFIYLSLPDDE